MSTIIIPGGAGLKLNLVSTVVNLLILYFIFKLVKEYFNNTVSSNNPVDIVKIFKSINVDISGLFSPSQAGPEKNPL